MKDFFLPLDSLALGLREKIKQLITNNHHMSAITFMPLQRLSPSDLLAFSQLNSSLICEMNTNGSIILKTPLYHKFSQIALKILEKLHIWNEKGSEGVVLDTKTGFVLSNGAIRHPSVSWVKPYKISSKT